MVWPGNRFLAQFGEEVESLRPNLRRVTLHPGQVLYEPGDRLRTVYFPESGAVSKLTVFEDGGEIENALVGREGVIGAQTALGLAIAVTRDICHMRASALAIDAALLTEAARQSETIRVALDHYCVMKMNQAARNGACNARHAVEPRLCRWLLTCSDVLESPHIRLPQDLFAKMLGVQRTSVNPILRRLQAEGLIELARARVTLKDRDQLASRACECYGAMLRLSLVVRPVNGAPAAAARSQVAVGQTTGL